MNKVIIKLKKENENIKLPKYMTEGAAGMDVYSNNSVPITLKPLERALIPTGLYLEIPYGYEIQVRPRSGLAIKHGITMLNTPGTIDSDYRGEIKIILINLSNDEYIINPQERIAQLVLQKVYKAEFKIVEALEESKRNSGGFGHTGK
ncbi:deoxyuridine 5'-triphosphate nucleotidohydrolase [Hypnocyclicus thermotrophus]|uniref:Deoxyuridine 5'-triphosphate nucleotidohydrolase n=1 Tax=Hypnocyclicus thermotrophus TaxID=1627895 RepID=A0AA46DY44_9FUSO|nr:dUTP diphosphatase [Hypnocyclicus thermotrophus]TDT69204.1 deoxyuridine 5'-triphosphate nucleotidohydrolase [Hypnocyclicus thermotrophus]